MTDRMSNVEIEDVLSSIRRLVSDELRPMPPLRPAAPRLMLTPALRVDRPVLAHVAEPAPEGVAPSDATLPAAEPALLLPEDPGDLALRLAELELLLDAQDHPFEAEGGEDLGPVSAAVWQIADIGGDPVPEAPFISDDGPVGLAELPDSPAPDWQAEASAAPQAPHGTAPDVLDAAPNPAATNPQEDGLLDLDAGMLRELIRDVLREELQGQMGERVTRNLRKMVRSELARALAARGLT